MDPLLAREVPSDTRVAGRPWSLRHAGAGGCHAGVAFRCLLGDQRRAEPSDRDTARGVADQYGNGPSFLRMVAGPQKMPLDGVGRRL